MQKLDEPFREIRVIVIDHKKVLPRIFKTNPEVGKTPRQLIQDMVNLDFMDVVSLPRKNLYVAAVNPAERGKRDDWTTLEDLGNGSCNYLDFSVAVNHEEYNWQLGMRGETDWD